MAHFSSAYTGQTYRRQPSYRWAALVTFLCIAGLKLTNHIHELYFRIDLVEMPFSHASVSYSNSTGP